MKKVIFLLVLSASISCAQSSQKVQLVANNSEADKLTEVNAPKTQELHNDSIKVGLEATFFRFKYEGEGYTEEDAIRFVLSVENRSKNPIPDIQSSRWDNVKIFINGKSEFELTIGNCVSGNLKLAPGETDSWNFDLQTTGPYAINFGNVFTFQWEFRGVLSRIIEVNIALGTVKTGDKFENK